MLDPLSECGRPVLGAIPGDRWPQDFVDEPVEPAQGWLNHFAEKDSVESWIMQACRSQLPHKSDIPCAFA